MTAKIEIAPNSDRELVLARIIDAPRASVYRCWTEPELIKQWFTPKPWSTVRAEMDVRPGGSTLVVMADPDGKEYPNPGLFLEVVPNEKLVFTDAYIKAWEPSGRPFMTVVLTFEDADEGKTRYIARVKHWTVEALKEHEAMGFHEGWGICADQLEEVAKRI